MACGASRAAAGPRRSPHHQQHPRNCRRQRRGRAGGLRTAGPGGQSGEGKNCGVGNTDPHHPPQLPNFPRPAGSPAGAEFEPRLGQRQPGYLRQSGPGPGCRAVRGGLASASAAAGPGPGPSSGWAGRALPAPLPPPMSAGTRAMRASPEEPASRSGRARYI